MRAKFMNGKISISLMLLVATELVCGQFFCSNQTLQIIDSSMALIFNSGKHYRKYPENKQELQPFCEEEYRAVKRVEEYKTKCMKNLPRQLTGIIVYTAKSMINNLCRKESKRLNRFLSSARCANIAHKSFDQCTTRFIDALLGTYHAEDRLKIPYVCCEYYKISSCMRDSARKYSVCTEDMVESTIQFTSDLTQNTAQVLCGEYTDDSDKCEKLPKRPNKRKNQIRPESFLLPFIHIFESFPEV